MKIHELGMQPYDTVWEQMKQFTSTRTPDTEDELWLLQHYPVYTQGQAGKPEHILNHNSIPVVQSDRGGQVTYHGPGQLVGYVLMDIGRRKLGIKTLVCQLEQILVKVLHQYQIDANTQCGAPGVYVQEKKIASIGLRVKNGCTYHGIALNVNMDLHPFQDINPCGFAKMQMTQIADFSDYVDVDAVIHSFKQEFVHQFKD